MGKDRALRKRTNGERARSRNDQMLEGWLYLPRQRFSSTSLTWFPPENLYLTSGPHYLHNTPRNRRNTGEKIVGGSVPKGLSGVNLQRPPAR